jgi:hypothetical protein
MMITKKELFIILVFVMLIIITEILCYLLFDSVSDFYKIILILLNFFWLIALWIYLKQL